MVMGGCATRGNKVVEVVQLRVAVVCEAEEDRQEMEKVGFQFGW
jgi:hypothetical protein